ncbi:hypothetical protein BX070DRAFT_219763 [Coemansia spiralis]|nr:hypothetical protein BX070DRAFT_219763 [Coemansia spiralis]
MLVHLDYFSATLQREQHEEFNKKLAQIQSHIAIDRIQWLATIRLCKSRASCYLHPSKKTSITESTCSCAL